MVTATKMRSNCRNSVSIMATFLATDKKVKNCQENWCDPFGTYPGSRGPFSKFLIWNNPCLRFDLTQLGREPPVSIRKNILLNAGYLERRFDSFELKIPYFCVRTFFRACLEHVTHADSQCHVTPLPPHIGHFSSTATFFCTQGSRFGEVRLYLTGHTLRFCQQPQNSTLYFPSSMIIFIQSAKGSAIKFHSHEQNKQSAFTFW